MLTYVTYLKYYLSIASMLIFLIYSPYAHSATSQNLTIAIESFPKHFNPALMSGNLVFSIGSQLFAGLTVLDSAGNAKPYLAKKWEVSDDGLTYIFFLHENAFFHDGTAVKTSDIIFSVKTSQKYHPFNPFLDNVINVTAKNEQTVIFHLKKKMPLLPTLLIPILVPILPEHVYGHHIPILKNPANIQVIGSGPFILKGIEKDKFIKLIKNPHFFLPENPKLDKITYQVFLDYDEILYSLGLRESDIALMFSSAQTTNFFTMYPRSEARIYKINNVYPYILATYNIKKEPFSNKKVRQAFSLALNRTALAKSIHHDSVQAMYGPLPKSNPFFSPVRQEYNIKKANILLDKAGYPRDKDGKRFEIILDYQNYPFNIDILRWLQNEFSSLLGIEIKTRKAASLAKSLDAVGAGDFDMLLDELFTWHDPLVGMHRVYSRKNQDKNIAWTNVGQYSNPKIDDLMDEASTQLDREKRQELYNQLQNMLADDYAALWLVSNDYYIIGQKGINNLDTLAFSIMSPLLNVYKSDKDN